MALFPFHTWQPDAYTYAPSAVTVLISTAMAKVNVYALVRVVLSVFTPAFIARFVTIWTFISWVAVAAIIVGSVLAIYQQNLKRMLAYSSVSHVGYLILALTLFKTHWGIPALTVHLLNHSIMKGCLFMTACGFVYKGLHDIKSLEGLASRMPYSCAAFTLAAISMIGIPPSVGFVTKLYIILASLESEQFLFVIVMILSSLLSLIYFWRVIEAMYMKGGGKEKDEIPASMLIPSILLAVLCIIFGIIWLSGQPSVISLILEKSVKGLIP